jgi:hypothetical protein
MLGCMPCLPGAALDIANAILVFIFIIVIFFLWGGGHWPTVCVLWDSGLVSSTSQS